MLEHILVPLDGSLLAESVLPHVTAVAQAFKAQVSLLQILERPVTADAPAVIDSLDWSFKEVEAKSYLNKIKMQLETSQLSVQTTLLECRAAEQIIEFAQNEQTDLLVLSTHGQHGFTEWKVSSVAQQILQRMPASILLVRANQSPTTESIPLRYRRLLVPLDGSWRAEAALPVAMALAQAHDAELILAQIVGTPEMARHMPMTTEDNELVARVIGRNQEEGLQYMAQMQAHLPGKSQTRLLVNHSVAAALQELVKQEQVDLVILSAHGFSGETQCPYGSITSRFISDGTTPLFIYQDVPCERLSEKLRSEVDLSGSQVNEGRPFPIGAKS